MSIIWHMWDVAEKRTRLPIILLVAAGYFLGVMLQVPSTFRWFQWFQNNSGYWGVVLPFLFLFYSGRDRLLQLLRDVADDRVVELTKADLRYEALKQVLSVVYAVCVSACIGLGVWFFVSSLGSNRFVSVFLGLFVFVGVLGSVLSGNLDGAGPE
jgi:hypothetical protein